VLDVFLHVCPGMGGIMRIPARRRHPANLKAPAPSWGPVWDFGDLLVMDWGVAKNCSDRPQKPRWAVSTKTKMSENITRPSWPGRPRAQTFLSVCDAEPHLGARATTKAWATQSPGPRFIGHRSTICFARGRAQGLAHSDEGRTDIYAVGVSD